MSTDAAIKRLVTLFADGLVDGAVTVSSFDARTWAGTVYDFAVDGGTTGDKTLSLVVPANTIIFGGFLRVVTPATSGGAATVALRIQGAADLLAATAFNATAIDAANDLVELLADATPILTTAERTLTMTIAGAALTAGKYQIVLQKLELPTV